MGIGLVIGGIIQLITPIPTPPGERKDTQNTSSNVLGTPNSVDQGGPLPIIYGRGIVPARPISVSSNSYDKIIYQPPVIPETPRPKRNTFRANR
jgi:predicted phage tail protein